MFSNLLLAVDGSEASLAAARRGIELAKALNARATVVTVTVPWSAYFARELAVVIPEVVLPKGDYDAQREATAKGLLEKIAGEARSAGIAVKAVHRSHRDPYQAILDIAAKEACDVIVMGCHQAAGLTGALLGSESMKLLAHGKVPVLVCRAASQDQTGQFLQGHTG
jgi:nucleotide-binding universal stress UspA family protein